MKKDKEIKQEEITVFFSERLREIRTNTTVSAREMSLSLKQNPGYINSIEKGKTLPTMASFFAICRFLDITPSQFFKPLESDIDKRKAELVKMLEKLDDKKLDAVYTILSGLQQ